ncbi:keratin, type I cytoskeletal 18-like [Thunnus maccoyii]|uniref:keratin, type I cytoskeletal 18-like n=1 Tax=Thunnus maccoyii TaxID=8240 RepID=UPI001C4D5612|nr:keratin, type I cytoskeletal 18-like [Thunnus maccoyii]
MIKRQSYQSFSGHSRDTAGSPKKNYAYSVSGGAGGHGTKVSPFHHPSHVGPSFDKHMFSEFSSVHLPEFTSGTPGNLAIGNEKITMQHLNDRLASYLETVRNLEKANSVLEIKIREAVEKSGPLEEKDYGRYNTIIAELRAKIFDMIKGNAHLAIQLDNASLASDDFRAKMEYEMSMRQAVDADIARLRKALDDTNVIRLHLETDIESLREELINLTKNHETDVAELRAQITYGVHVDVDAPKGQDLARIMDEMRAKYEKIALKNQEDLKAWHESQITEVQGKVAEKTTALKEATTVITEIRRRHQGLDIELQSELSLKAALEANLHDIDRRYNMEVEKYNAIILRLQEELTRLRTDIQHNTQEYEHLLNIKVKLEAEIAEYRRLLDGGADFKLEDAVDNKKVHTEVVTVTRTLVDGKVVAESKDVKSSDM